MKPVAIICAGVAGIAAAKYALEEKLKPVVFEREEAIGRVPRASNGYAWPSFVKTHKIPNFRQSRLSTIKQHSYSHADFPLLEVWRFFIDGEYQKTDPLLQNCLDLMINPLTDEDLSLPLKDFLKKEKVFQIKYGEKIRNVEWEHFLRRCSHINDVKSCSLPLRTVLKIKNGWLKFEKDEPGYLKAILKGFLYSLDYKQSLNTKFICHLHDLVIKEVKNTTYDKDHSDYYIGAFRRYTDVQFGLAKNNSTPAGISEIIKKMNNGHSYLYLWLGKPGDGRYMISSLNDIKKHIPDFIESYQLNKAELMIKDVPPLVLESISGQDDSDLMSIIGGCSKLKFELPNPEKWCPKFIDTYNTDIIKAKNNDEKKLKVIVTLIRDLEQLHPFLDGNCRVFCMILLNHLLVKNKFPPAILSNPNCFDGYDIESLIDQVIDGMERSLQLLHEKDSELFGVRTKEILDQATELQKRDFFAALEPLKKWFKSPEQQNTSSRSTEEKVLNSSQLTKHSIFSNNQLSSIYNNPASKDRVSLIPALPIPQPEKESEPEIAFSWCRIL